MLRVSTTWLTPVLKGLLRVYPPKLRREHPGNRAHEALGERGGVIVGHGGECLFPGLKWIV